jgi:cation-transporting ATPase E
LNDIDYPGLTSQQVEERKAQGLQNKSTRTRSKKTSEIIIQNVFSVFNLIILSIMIFLLVFYFRSGDKRLLLDSIGAFSVALINTLIAVIQELRAKRALDKVNLLLKKEVKVIRDGKPLSIDQNEIVVGDLIFIERGDQIVVDGKIFKSNNLEIDESLLTGESAPIDKGINEEILSGSFCVSGNGFFIAEKVGDRSYASEITKLAKKFKLNLSPLQIKLNFIVKSLFGISLILVLLEVIFRMDNSVQIDFVRRISTIMLSLVPQGLVLMSSVTFALGIYRISKIGAIIQKLNAIESFSNVKVVCTDKTGTLTKNHQTVKCLSIISDAFSDGDVEKMLGTYHKFSSDKNATLRTLEKYPVFEDAEILDEIPFSSENKSSFLELKISHSSIILVLGGYDILSEKLDMIHKKKSDELLAENKLSIYRNLLFGKVKSVDNLQVIKSGSKQFEIEPICIISIADQVREDVMDAIRLFKNNDIQVKILSGDAATAIQAIAKDIGWDIKDDELISGNQLENLNIEEWKNIVNDKSVFARLKPEHKLKIIKSLKEQKIYTAMIGDGVNDLPAIKESDMGIAMEEGSNITKEVADIVLLKNKFALLPKIFDEGNKIVNTVNSVAKLFLTKNFMIICLALITLSFLFKFPLTPRRVSLINIFSIGIPALVIALKNTNVRKTKNFITDLLSFVIISALVITGSAYAGQFYLQSCYSISETDLKMVMLSIMIITTVSNFLIVALRKDEKNLKNYLFYAFLILIIYIFLAVTNIDFPVFNGIKEFYEIIYLKPEYWGTVAVISLSGSVLLFLLQKLRQSLIYST